MQRYKEGSIILDIIDAKTKGLIWRGVAQGTVHNREGEPERVNEAVFKILEGYPPS